MLQTQEQISATARDSMQKQTELFASFAFKAFESMEKLSSLNLNAMRASLEESGVMTRRLLAAKGPQEFLSLLSALALPNAEKALFYGRHLVSIASDTQSELTKVTEAQVAEVNHRVAAMAEAASKNVPAGSGNIAAIIQSAIEAANASYEQASRTRKQVLEAAEAGLNSVVDQFAQAEAKKPVIVE